MTDTSADISELREIHRFLSIIQDINVGVIVVDTNYTVRVWNSFMEVNSGILGIKINGKCLFDVFPEIRKSWLYDKITEATTLNTPVFNSWRQHKEIFHFPNNRPFTGRTMEMRQNFTIIPLSNLDGKIDEVLIMIYDVTDEACAEINLEKANSQLLKSSITDGLTGLYNRKHWENCLSEAYDLFRRNKEPVTLLMFDIDHFKSINDTYGHQAGDTVLKRLSQVVKKQIRNTDVAGRYGGEEFTIILRDANRESSFYVAERLRHAIESQVVEYNNPKAGGIQVIRFTISIGVCTLSIPAMPNYGAWLKKADNALYFSKEHGRNRTTEYGLNDTEETMNIEIQRPVIKKRDS